VRREKSLAFGGCNHRPAGNRIAPPDGNQSRLFLGNEKCSFLGISLRQRGSARSVAGRLSVIEPVIVNYRGTRELGEDSA
jgi:hypothetical protein